MSLLFIFLFTALLVSFLCSVSEAVLLSITPAYIEVLRQNQAKCADLLLLQKQNIEKPLAAILSLNTIAHTIGAVGVGAQSAVLFGNAYVSITSAVMTLLILILSEIIPKSLGAAYWRSLAPVISPSVNVLEVLMYPFVVLSEKFSKCFSSEENASVFRHEEFKAMAILGSEEGKLEAKESRIVRNLFRLRDLTVRDIMTPRPVVFSLSSEMKVEDVMHKHPKLPFSRIPIHEANVDNIIGFVLKNDIFYEQATVGGGKALKEMRRELHAVNDWKPLSELLEFLLDHRQHIVMVTNEFGAFDGVVTLEDTVETLLGMEIVDEALDKGRELQDRLSNYGAGSEINMLNISRSLKVSPELFEIIEEAKDISRITDGEFDVTVAPILKTSGFYK